MSRRARRGDVAVVFGLFWAVSCIFLVWIRIKPRTIKVADTSSASKPRVFEPTWPSDSDSNSLFTNNATISLVETLPLGDLNLSSSNLQTFEALTCHVRNAKHSIDLSAMYWDLLGEEDRKSYSDAEMTQFGADRGKNLLLALKDAALRGVALRVLTSKPTDQMSCTPLPHEVEILVNATKGYIQVRCWSGPEWYGSGILHQKIWIFDNRHAYVGSANMDWKSLAQVMEVGVIMENLLPSSSVIQDVSKLFETWWLFASPELLPVETDSYYSEKYQHTLQVPKWSLYLAKESRSEDPFVVAGFSALGNISHQLQTSFLTLSNRDSKSVSKACEMFISAAPLEATAGHSRAFDEHALVYTIRSAKAFVSLSVMDFEPFSMYTPGPLYWPALTDALLAGVYSKPGLRVRLLISQWQHSSPQMLNALATLEQQAEYCQHTHARCSGRLEIKLFRVPGWQNTTSRSRPKASWPSYTRVNHAKYIVTDTRANVGTSNMEWGYFYTTAGASVNTNHEPTRKALEDIFMRNWNSSYAKSLRNVMLESL
ncbi:hypothetical protein CCR75_005044 [Bremia lactucae]|uniref:PLD phosphodiesterase domain-containing protein n=1 Tax=Bremia lactucae TaxID=4779 RepID=A0A976FN05_BRELC|nr:hypothetical protein CCR75_005044 [Bremia lactucae]